MRDEQEKVPTAVKSKAKKEIQSGKQVCKNYFKNQELSLWPIILNTYLPSLHQINCLLHKPNQHKKAVVLILQLH